MSGADDDGTPPPSRRRRVPPAEHRFRPGQSGNPRGRPRAKGIATDASLRSALLAILEMPVSPRGGEPPISLRDAILRTACGEALKDGKFGLRLLPMLFKVLGEGPQELADPFENSEQVIEAFVRRRMRALRARNRRGGAGPNTQDDADDHNDDEGEEPKDA